MKPAVTLLTIVAVAITISCREKHVDTANKFSDPVLVKIYDFKDRRLADSLYQYFSSPEEVYREEAVLAFASIQDSLGVTALGKMLNDESPRVRSAAAFSIGQTSSSLGEALLTESLKTEKEKSVREELIESYGKVTRRWDPSWMGSDALVSERLSWSIYRAGLRGIANPHLDSVASILLGPSFDQTTRLGAAHYFSRTAKNFEKFESTIINSATHDSSAEVRIASTLALGKIITDSSLFAVRSVLKNERDYRVRVSAVRALRPFAFKKIKSDLIYALPDTNINVAIAASELMVSAIDNESWKELLPICRGTRNGRVRANLYGGILAASDNKEVAEEVVRSYREATNPYDKAALLSSLSSSVMSFGFVQEQLAESSVPVIKTAAASTLVAINHRKNFDSLLKEKFAGIYRKAIEDGDPGVIAIVCFALADSTLEYRGVIKDVSFLIEAKTKLSLPRHIETIVPINAAIAYLEEKRDEPSQVNTFNTPVDWSVVKSIRKNQTASMSTTKGVIIIRLYVEEAPGSVANFVSLINKRYYDNIFFHRVVPNFVAQAGCNRGDGYGSEDYSIRSEFSQRRYSTGSIGMASAGKDTEGTQWFITHSPTPHLDGAYSIFGEVVEGMDVVHSLEVGDKILKIDLIN
ncbi:MAG TPA: peptidylprolyl isomerase [Chryseolinea sp.]|nr:peptidylprolyl isomerase [Chryseolinea sp.]